MPLIMANSKDGQDNMDIYFDSSRKILSQEMTMCNIYILKVMTNVDFLKKLVKCLGQKVKYQQKDFITGNTHVNYQSSSTHN